MGRMSLKRGLAGLVVALAAVGGTAACTDAEQVEDDAPSQGVPEQQEDDD